MHKDQFSPEAYSLLNSPVSPSQSHHDSATLSRGTDKIFADKLPLDPINEGFLPVVRPTDIGNIRSILMIKSENRSPFSSVTLNQKNLTNLAGRMLTKPPDPSRKVTHLTVKTKGTSAQKTIETGDRTQSQMTGMFAH